jgi:hypothetical protein
MGAGYGRFDELDLSTGLRVAVGFRLLPQRSVFAGPTLELLTSRVRDKLGYVVSL